MKNIFKVTRKNAILLSTVAFICTALSAGSYFLTRSQIADEIANQKRDLLAQVVPTDMYNNDLLATCGKPNGVFAHDKNLKQMCIAKENDKTVAYVFETIAPNGYSGPIHLIVGLTPAGEVLGVRVTEENETPGLGDKIELKHSNWILSFAHKFIEPNNPQNMKEWAVKKDGGEFDQFTGATITPRAVVNQVKLSSVSVLSILKDMKEAQNTNKE